MCRTLTLSRFGRVQLVGRLSATRRHLFYITVRLVRLGVRLAAAATSGSPRLGTLLATLTMTLCVIGTPMEQYTLGDVVASIFYQRQVFDSNQRLLIVQIVIHCE